MFYIELLEVTYNLQMGCLNIWQIMFYFMLLILSIVNLMK